MIQRVQSIYLLVAAIISLASYFIFPKLDLFFINMSLMDYFIIPYLFFCFFMSTLNIFLFINRKLQININKFQLLIHLFVLIVFFYFFYQEKMLYSDLIWTLTPLLSIVFLSLANNGIKKDENLIRSVDRLR